MTDLIEVKTADLTGPALDWAVAQAEGLETFLVGPQYGVPWRVFWKKRGQALVQDALYNPHENWALGGPLADKHCKVFGLNKHIGENGEWRAFAYKDSPQLMRLAGGETLLVAICRSIALLHLGDTVQVPKELIQ